MSKENPSDTAANSPPNGKNFPRKILKPQKSRAKWLTENVLSTSTTSVFPRFPFIHLNPITNNYLGNKIKSVCPS